MRIGVILDTEQPFDDVVGQVAALHEAGIEMAWSSQIFGYDALTALAVVGREVPGIGLGTAVVPTYPRHPVMLAGQALTVQAATGGRLTLGIGLSHQLVIENVFGQSFDKPARHMREYLSILIPVLQGEQVTYRRRDAERVDVRSSRHRRTAACRCWWRRWGRPCSRIAGRMAAGHRHLDDRPGHHRVAHRARPSAQAAAEAGRPDPQVAVGLPVCVTDDAGAARAKAGEVFAMYGHLPSYRAMLDREGAEGPADVAIVGSAAEVTAQIRRLADIGATDFFGALFGTADEQIRRSTEVLADLVGS